MALIKRQAHLPQPASPPGAGLPAVPDEKLVAVVPPPAISPELADMIAQVHARLYPRMWARAARKVGREVADDIVQDVFEKLVRQWTRLTPEQLTDAAIVKRLKDRITDYIRSRDRKPAAVEYTEDLEEQGLVPCIGPVEPGTVLFVEEAVRQVVPQLPTRIRETWELVRDKGFTYEEAAEEMQIGVEGVKSNLKRGNVLVCEAMTDQGYFIEEGRLVKALPRSTEASHD